MIDDNSVFHSLDVSRETMEMFDHYESLVQKWSPKINLVAKSTLVDLRSRHIADSAGLFSHLHPSTKKTVDLGSGGGFPGLVVAILSQQFLPENRMTLVESDKRKSVFLLTVARELGLDITVITRRIEEAAPQAADVVMARALAPLPKLLGYVDRHLNSEGYALLPKGIQAEDEIEMAKEAWQFEIETRRATGVGSILKVSNIKQIEQHK